METDISDILRCFDSGTGDMNFIPQENIQVKVQLMDKMLPTNWDGFFHMLFQKQGVGHFMKQITMFFLPKPFHYFRTRVSHIFEKQLVTSSCEREIAMENAHIFRMMPLKNNPDDGFL